MKLRTHVLMMSVFLLSILLGLPSAGFAQIDASSECPYSECSLRLKSGFFGRSLVRGVGEQKLTGLGFWVGDLDPVFPGSPEALDLGARYRHRHNLGALFALAGLAAVVTGYSQNGWDPFSADNDTGVGLVVSGALLSFVGGIISQSGEDALHKAIWEYNRTLVQSPSTGGDAS